MSTMTWFAATVVIALIFGIFVMRFDIPAGGMIGGMIGVAAFNVVFQKAYIYPYVRIAVQICLGAMSGSRVGRKELKDMWRLIGPIACMFAVLIVLNVVFGCIIVKMTGMDIRTALLSITAGGATDMIFVAEDVGADTGMVGLMQSLRMLFCNGALPILFVELISRNQGSKAEERKGGMDGEAGRQSDEKLGGKLSDTGVGDSSGQKEAAANSTAGGVHFSPKELAMMFAFAATGGLLFRFFGIPGGTLVGAMIFTVAYSCIFGKTMYPKKLKKYQQIITGAYIGVSITRQTIAMIPSMAVAMLVIIVDILIYVFLMAFIFRKISDMDYGTCLLCSTPGGVGEVSILSEDLGTDTAVVATVNTIRMILVVSTFPAIISLIAKIL